MLENSVVELKNYGKIVLCAKAVMDTKGVTRGKLSKLAHIRFEVADKWYKGAVERIDVDVLAKVCFALECEPQDIIKYVK